MKLIVVLHEPKIWCLILREEHGLRVFYNSKLRNIFGPKSKDVTEDWGKLRNEGLHHPYSSRENISRKMIGWAHGMYRG
jgi:hypothetical protein